MASPTIVFNTATPQFLENRIFDRNYAARFPGGLAFALLYEEAIRRGWQMVTADLFLASPLQAGSTVCLSDMFTPYTNRLLEHGVIPAVILSGESPNVAWDFYHNLERYTRDYRHAFLFRGAGERVRLHTQVHSLYWPNASRSVIYDLKWSERELLVMVASDKQRFSVSPHMPLPSLRSLVRQLKWVWLQWIDPLFRFEDLYQKRLDAICYFSDRPGFQLYGTGWDKPGRMSKVLQAAKRVNATRVDDKLKAMSGFRFALCFENCVFPGYVTEKIFDCFFVGCIPVYWGAPDITDFVPSETFVDARKFGCWVDLDRYMREMSEREVERLHSSASDFLASDAFAKFHQDYFVTELLSILEAELENGIKTL